MARFTHLVRLGVVLAVLSAPALAHGDQSDPRLDDLFARLKAAPTAEAAAPLEAQIWAIWGETGDDKAAALMALGRGAMQAGAHSAALIAFDKVVALAPDFAEGWNLRATVHYLLDELDASLADIAKTLALEPRHFGALSGRGLVYMKKGDLERALQSFEAALAINPHMAGPRINAEAVRRLLKQREI